jgi:hypothetical protein
MEIRQPKLILKIIMKRVVAISLYPISIYIKAGHGSPTTINHECIHWEQQKEMFGLFFYIWYLLEWVIKLFRYGRKSYNNISFEREAYKNASNKDYLLTRKRFAWIKYIAHE